MKAYKLLVILAAAVVGLVFCGCGEDKGPEIIREVSRMNHFLRIDISNELLSIADVTCECVNIYGEKVEYDFYGATTVLDDNTWKPDSGTPEPKQVVMTLKATPRGDSDTTSSTFRLEATIMSEFTVYDQNNNVMGYNGFEKSMSKTVNAGVKIAPILEANFPVTYSFIIAKGDDGTYGVQVQ